MVSKACSSSQSFSWGGIPEEVLVNIFSYLDVQTLARVKQVCVVWRRVASDDMFYAPFLSNHATAPAIGLTRSAVSMESLCDKIASYFFRLKEIPNRSLAVQGKKTSSVVKVFRRKVKTTVLDYAFHLSNQHYLLHKKDGIVILDKNQKELFSLFGGMPDWPKFIFSDLGGSQRVALTFNQSDTLIIADLSKKKPEDFVSRNIKLNLPHHTINHFVRSLVLEERHLHVGMTVYCSAGRAGWVYSYSLEDDDTVRSVQLPEKFFQVLGVFAYKGNLMVVSEACSGFLVLNHDAEGEITEVSLGGNVAQVERLHNRVVFGLDNGRVVVVDLELMEIIQQFDRAVDLPGSRIIRGMSVDGDLVAVATCMKGNPIELWNAKAGTKLGVLKTRGVPTKLRFNSNGDLIAHLLGGGLCVWKVA